MTNQEWKRRCVARILVILEKEQRMRVRSLKRATHYNRGPEGESIPLWYEALDQLERAKRITVDRDENGMETFAAMSGKQVSPVGRNTVDLISNQ